MRTHSSSKGLIIFITLGVLFSLVSPIATLAQEPVYPTIHQDDPILENTKPVAAADSYTMDAGTTLTVSAADGVLDNDSDADGDTLTAQFLGGAPNGQLTLYPDGGFVYTPDLGFSGSDYFTYQAYDGTIASRPAQVTINVTGGITNTAPVAVADNYSVEADTTLDVNADDGVLANDYDAEDDPLTASLVGGVANGNLMFYPDGSFCYVPDAGYTGDDHFLYKASDGLLESNPVLVTISVTGGSNTAPVAVADNYSMDAGTTLIVDAANGVLENDYDAEEDPLTATVIGEVANGSLMFNPDGSFTYLPDAGFTGDEHFLYTASDGLLESNPVLVTITVSGASTNAPVAVLDVYTGEADAILSVDALHGVLANDTDADGDEITAQLMGGVAFGQLSFNPDGSFTYTPNAGFVGVDHFTYQASDGVLTSNPVMVTINVLLYTHLPCVWK